MACACNLYQLEREKIDESLKSYERAIKIKPDYAEAYFNKGGVLLALNVNGEALTNFKKVLEIKPDFESLSGTMMYTKLKLCNWENFNKDLENPDRNVRRTFATFMGVAKPGSPKPPTGNASHSNQDKYTQAKSELGR